MIVSEALDGKRSAAASRSKDLPILARAFLLAQSLPFLFHANSNFNALVQERGV
jgi:hypothetical protein